LYFSNNFIIQAGVAGGKSSNCVLANIFQTLYAVNQSTSFLGSIALIISGTNIFSGSGSCTRIQ